MSGHASWIDCSVPIMRGRNESFRVRTMNCKKSDRNRFKNDVNIGKIDVFCQLDPSNRYSIIDIGIGIGVDIDK